MQNPALHSRSLESLFLFELCCTFWKTFGSFVFYLPISGFEVESPPSANCCLRNVKDLNVKIIGRFCLLSLNFTHS